MNENTTHLVSYLSTLGALVALSAAFAFMHDPQHAEMALIGALTYAGVQAPRSPLPARLGAAASVLPIVAAIGLSTALAGCGASLPAIVGVGQAVGPIVVQGTCIGADKLCEAADPACGSGACHVAHDVCAAIAPTTPVQLSCSAPPSASKGLRSVGLRFRARTRLRGASIDGDQPTARDAADLDAWCES